MFTKRFDTFLSFCSVDADAAREMHRLLGTLGIAAWLDDGNMQAGLAVDQLVAGIDNSDTVTVLCGGRGEGPWQRFEVASAISSAVEIGNFPIVVLLPGADATHVPRVLKACVRIEFPDFLPRNPLPLAKLERMVTGAPRGTIRRGETNDLLAKLNKFPISDEAALGAYLALADQLPGLADSFDPPEGNAFEYCFRRLAQMPHRSGQMPTVAYLAACRPHLAGLKGVNALLVDLWVKRIEARLGSVALTAISTVKVGQLRTVELLVKVTPNRFSEQFLLDAWLLEKGVFPGPAFYFEHEPGVSARTLPEHFAKTLQTLYAKRPDLERNADFHLQVFLPMELLTSPVDRWEINLGGTSKGACSLRHRVSVRSFERTYDAAYRQTWPEWQAKWERSLQGVEPAAVYVVESDNDHTAADYRLMRKDVTALLCLQPLANGCYPKVDAALVGGIPALLLQRAKLTTKPDAGALLAELTREIRDWPHRVRALRCKGLPDAPFWQDVTIVLDDPDTLPPDWDLEQVAPLAV